MKSSVDNLLTADFPNVLRAHTPKTFNRRDQTSLFISQCLLNKYEPGRSNLTEIYYHKYLNLCSLYNELNKFLYNKDYPKLFEPSSKAIIDCLTLQSPSQSLMAFPPATNHTHQLLSSHQHLYSYILCKLVGCHLLCPHKLKFNLPTFNLLPDEVITNRNVLAAFMEDRILSYLHARLIVTQQENSFPLMIYSHLHLQLV